MTQTAGSYVIVWEFRIRQGKEAEFIEKYGPEGIWAGFFGGSQTYIRTELVRDVTDQQRFLTLDYWQSEKNSRSFASRIKPNTSGWIGNVSG